MISVSLKRSITNILRISETDRSSKFHCVIILCLTFQGWSLSVPKPVLDDVNQQMASLKDFFVRQMADKDKEIEEFQRRLDQEDQKLYGIECCLDAQGTFLRREAQKLTNAAPQSQTNVFQWRINEWSREISDAKSQSPAGESDERTPLRSAMFTVANGYRGYLALFPNGKKSADDGHVTLFFYLAGDQHDDLLWPFPYSCEISIVNESDEAKSIRKRLSIQKRWEKPTPSHYDGAGLHKMASHGDLASLIRNDSMLVRLSVDC